MRRRARRTQHNWQVFGLAGTHRFGAPNGRRFPVMMTSADDGGRSCIPLRDSPGFPPGSLSRHASYSCRSMRRATTRRKPVAPLRLPLRIGSHPAQPVGEGVGQAAIVTRWRITDARSADPVDTSRAQRPTGWGASLWTLSLAPWVIFSGTSFLPGPCRVGYSIHGVVRASVGNRS